MASRSLGIRPFTEPAVPTGMKRGVSTAPWGVKSLPTRALPARASTWKRKGSIRPWGRSAS